MTAYQAGSRDRFAKVITLAWALAVIGLWCSTMPAVAICTRLEGTPPDLPGGPDQVVFVGMADEVSSNPQDALFHVREVWYGSSVPEWQPVFSQADGGGIWEDSPNFRQGRTYLVVARREGSSVVSEACGGTQRYSSELDSLRPSDAKGPVPIKRPDAWDPMLDAGIPWQLPTGTVLGIVFVLVFVIPWLGRKVRAAQERPG